MIRAPYDSALVPSRETRFVADEQIITVAGAKVVALPEAKKVLKVKHSEDDVYITALIDAVTAQIEGYIRQDISQKERKARWKRNQRLARLPFGPHGDIVTAKVIDVNGHETTLVEGAHYRLNGIKFKYLDNFEVYGELIVEFESGWDECPPEARAAIYQELSLQYKNRQDPDTPGFTSYRNLSIEARHLLAPLIRLY